MHIKNSNQTSDKPLQWHPAFYAGLQIEFADEANHLIFENEHHLGTKPKILDVLIIKKNPTISIQKNIGRIFRTHNIIEYKSPDDSLSIDDFYLVYAYACMYKSDTKHIDEIPAEEISISFVSSKYPRKLVEHLINIRKYTVQKVDNGIYYIEGDFFPIQFIISSQLPQEENFWLYNLRNNIKDREDALCILDQYQKHRHQKLYTSVMDIIVNANNTLFQEVNPMSEALWRLYKDQFEEHSDEIIRLIAEEKAVEMAEERAEKLAEERAEKLAEERAEKLAEQKAEKLAESKFKELFEKATAEKDAYIKKLESLLAMQTNASAQP